MREVGGNISRCVFWSKQELTDEIYSHPEEEKKSSLHSLDFIYFTIVFIINFWSTLLFLLLWDFFILTNPPSWITGFKRCPGGCKDSFTPRRQNEGAVLINISRILWWTCYLGEILGNSSGKPNECHTVHTHWQVGETRQTPLNIL